MHLGDNPWRTPYMEIWHSLVTRVRYRKILISAVTVLVTLYNCLSSTVMANTVHLSTRLG